MFGEKCLSKLLLVVKHFVTGEWMEDHRHTWVTEVRVEKYENPEKKYQNKRKKTWDEM